MNTNPVAERIAAHKKSGRGGIVSVCSAHPAVLDAALDIAREYGDVLLIESTSNQVDQFGGYTGKTPAEFIAQTRERVLAQGFPEEKLAFGGDHLGPNVWQNLPAAEAMNHAEELIRHYAAAGYDKIHLDCSMSCADDPVPLDDETVARRAARLCKIAEAHKTRDMVYIIGTEVPVPGGAQEDLAEHGVTPTSPEAAQTTWNVHQRIFAEEGLADVWPRVIGLVVQPGVEFDHHQVIDYQPARAQALSQVAEGLEYAVFEAHSTDYQSAPAFKQLVRDHFAILKVGPALTFAYREALFALEAALADYHGTPYPGAFRAAVEKLMLEQPKYWQKYYEGDENEQRRLRAFSLSDRIRYYWPQLEAPVAKLIADFDAAKIPFGIVHQYLPHALDQAHNRGEAPSAENLIRHHIRAALKPYYDACAEK